MNFNFYQYKMSLFAPFKKMENKKTPKNPKSTQTISQWHSGKAVGRVRVGESGLWAELCHSVGCTTGKLLNCFIWKMATFAGFLPDLKALGSEDLR